MGLSLGDLGSAIGGVGGFLVGGPIGGAIGASIGGGIGSGIDASESQKEATEAAREVNRIQQRSAAVRNERSRLRGSAEAVRQRASITAAGATGGFTSTAVSGVESSIASQFASNVGFSRQLSALDEERFAAQDRQIQKEGKAARQAATSSSLFGLGGSILGII